MRINPIKRQVLPNDKQGGIMNWFHDPYRNEKPIKVLVRTAPSGSQGGFFDKLIVRLFEKGN